MGRFFTTLVIFGGIVSVFFVARDYFAAQKIRTNPWVQDMRDVISQTLKPSVEPDAEDPWFADEGRFFSLLAMMHEVERGKYDLESTVGSAVNVAKPGVARMIADSLKESYQTAKTLGVFKEPGNLLAMERGDAPVATAAGWEEEKLTVGHRVSPLLAPEAARSLANLVLMPESVRDMQQVGSTTFTLETIKLWRKEELISPESAEAIAEIVLPKPKF